MRRLIIKDGLHVSVDIVCVAAADPLRQFQICFFDTLLQFRRIDFFNPGQLECETCR